MGFIVLQELWDFVVAVAFDTVDLVHLAPFLYIDNTWIYPFSSHVLWRVKADILTVPLRITLFMTTWVSVFMSIRMSTFMTILYECCCGFRCGHHCVCLCEYLCEHLYHATMLIKAQDIARCSDVVQPGQWLQPTLTRLRTQHPMNTMLDSSSWESGFAVLAKLTEVASRKHQQAM